MKASEADGSARMIGQSAFSGVAGLSAQDHLGAELHAPKRPAILAEENQGNQKSK